MTHWKLLLTAPCLTLAACGGGGGGGGGVSSVPTPTPPPTPTPAVVLIGKASTSTTFTGKGATIGLNGSVSLADSDLLAISYSATSGNYTVTVPGRTASTLVSDPNSAPAPGSPQTSFVFAPDGHMAAYGSSELEYSNIAAWVVSPWLPEEQRGIVAFGIPTAANTVPVTGSANYSAHIYGISNETYFDNLAGANMRAWIVGDMGLLFNFGAGTLSGSITPVLDSGGRFDLGNFAFTNTVYATGSPTFGGSFATMVPGQNSFAGLFTGPAAQELIGNFAFPYISPVDGKSYQSVGAFAGKKDGGP